MHLLLRTGTYLVPFIFKWVLFFLHTVDVFFNWKMLFVLAFVGEWVGQEGGGLFLGVAQVPL